MFGRYYQFGWTGAEDGTAIDRANNIYLFSFGYAAGCESGGRAGDEFASGVIPENGNRIPTGRGSPDVETSFPCVSASTRRTKLLVEDSFLATILIHLIHSQLPTISF